MVSRMTTCYKCFSNILEQLKITRIKIIYKTWGVYGGCTIIYKVVRPCLIPHAIGKLKMLQKEDVFCRPFNA